ncbi:MAG: hypothetical protein PHF64_06165 [Methanoregula sp.]|nr:hypothetical protein [Methanoregula sp.]
MKPGEEADPAIHENLMHPVWRGESPEISGQYAGHAHKKCTVALPT